MGTHILCSRWRELLAAVLIAAAGSAFLAQAQDRPRDPQDASRAPTQARQAALGREALLLAENRAAMNKMMTGMNVQPSGDADRDFDAMMEAHHQGAIDMAEAELRYGRNEQLRRIAQEIIVTQQQEIAAMRLAVGAPLPPSVASPTHQLPAADPAAAPLATHRPMK